MNRPTTIDRGSKRAKLAVLFYLCGDNHIQDYTRHCRANILDAGILDSVHVAVQHDAADGASRRIVYEVVLSENQGNFKFGDTKLPEAAMTSIDQMIQQILADPKGAYFEIEGHTDNVGGKELNERIGMERAEAVKRYLYEKHQIPLHRMNVISYGEDKPEAPNNTRDGRAQNRRVVIRVLG